MKTNHMSIVGFCVDLLNPFCNFWQFIEFSVTESCCSSAVTIIITHYSPTVSQGFVPRVSPAYTQTLQPLMVLRDISTTDVSPCIFLLKMTVHFLLQICRLCFDLCLTFWTQSNEGIFNYLKQSELNRIL